MTLTPSDLVDRETTRETVPLRAPGVAISGKMGSGKSELAAGLVQRGYARLSIAGPLHELAKCGATYVGQDVAAAVGVWGEAIGIVSELVEHAPNKIAASKAWCEVCTKNRQELRGYGKPRRFLQDMGDALGVIDRECLYLDLERRAGEYIERGIPVVIDDLRLRLEASRLLRAGYVMVRVACDDQVRRDRLGMAVGDIAEQHATETELDEWSWDLVLDGEWPAERMVEAVLERVAIRNLAV